MPDGRHNIELSTSPLSKGSRPYLLPPPWHVDAEVNVIFKWIVQEKKQGNWWGRGRVAMRRDAMRLANIEILGCNIFVLHQQNLSNLTQHHCIASCYPLNLSLGVGSWETSSGRMTGRTLTWDPSPSGLLTCWTRCPSCSLPSTPTSPTSSLLFYKTIYQHIQCYNLHITPINITIALHVHSCTPTSSSHISLLLQYHINMQCNDPRNTARSMQHVPYTHPQYYHITSIVFHIY